MNLKQIVIGCVWVGVLISATNNSLAQNSPTPIEVISRVAGQDTLMVDGKVELRSEGKDDSYKQAHSVDVAYRTFQVAVTKPNRVIPNTTGRVIVNVRRYPTVRDCAISSQTRLANLEKGQGAMRNGIRTGYVRYRPLDIGERAGQALQVADTNSPTSAKYLAECRDGCWLIQVAVYDVEPLASMNGRFSVNPWKAEDAAKISSETLAAVHRNLRSMVDTSIEPGVTGGSSANPSTSWAGQLAPLANSIIGKDTPIIPPEKAAVVAALVSSILIAAGVAVNTANSVATAIANAIQSGIQLTMDDVGNIVHETIENETRYRTFIDPWTGRPLQLRDGKYLDEETGRWMTPVEAQVWVEEQREIKREQIEQRRREREAWQRQSAEEIQENQARNRQRDQEELRRQQEQQRRNAEMDRMRDQAERFAADNPNANPEDLQEIDDIVNRASEQGGATQADLDELRRRARALAESHRDHWQQSADDWNRIGTNIDRTQMGVTIILAGAGGAALSTAGMAMGLSQAAAGAFGGGVTSGYMSALSEISKGSSTGQIVSHTLVSAAGGALGGYAGADFSLLQRMGIGFMTGSGEAVGHDLVDGKPVNWRGAAINGLVSSGGEFVGDMAGRAIARGARVAAPDTPDGLLLPGQMRPAANGDLTWRNPRTGQVELVPGNRPRPWWAEQGPMPAGKGPDAQLRGLPYGSKIPPDIAPQTGYAPRQIEALQNIAKNEVPPVVIGSRTTNMDSLQHIVNRTGTPKPVDIKSKTIQELDTYLHPDVGSGDKGLVGLFKPVEPDYKNIPAELRDQVRERFRLRKTEFDDLAQAIKGRADVEMVNGKVHKVFPDGTKTPFAGDIDPVFIKDAATGRPLAGQRYQDVLNKMQNSAAEIQHGAEINMAMDVLRGQKPGTPAYEKTLGKIMDLYPKLEAGHVSGKELVVEFWPDGTMRRGKPVTHLPMEV